MLKIAFSIKKLKHLFEHSCSKIAFFRQSYRGFKVNPFWMQLCYFVIVSSIGYLALRVSKPKPAFANTRPKSFDVFFTSVSATTDSSMGTVEMEVFSNTQLIIMTILMLVGGEVFISMLCLLLVRSTTKFPNSQSTAFHPSNSIDSVDQIELDLVSFSHVDHEKPNNITSSGNNIIKSSSDSDHHIVLKHNSVRYLRYVVLGYLLVVHIGGSSLVTLYISLVPSARQVLKKKGLGIQTFSVFTTVSTFSNCGFVPTNENMIVFKNNSGLLLLLIPQILLGNTLYPTCLRFVIWVLKKITKREEFEYMLKNPREIGYCHLLSSFHSCLLAVTVFGFIIVQWVLFCSLEWNSEAMADLTSYEKIVASLFEVVNSRHTGESVFDLSIIAPAILVLFVLMMYLPPYTSFLPIRDSERNPKVRKQESKSVLEWLTLSQLSYLVIFIILICITERHKMKEDPLNFNVLNITIEVISAYGNVGFSTGYSCKRRLKPGSSCKDTWYGFVGRWSHKGKFILILVMFYGRIKKFNMKGGNAWKLS